MYPLVDIGPFLEPLRLVRLRLEEESSKTWPDRQVIEWCYWLIFYIVGESEALKRGDFETAEDFVQTRRSDAAEVGVGEDGADSASTGRSS